MTNDSFGLVINKTDLFKNRKFNVEILEKKFFSELLDNDYNIKTQEINIICRFVKTNFKNNISSSAPSSLSAHKGLKDRMVAGEHINGTSPQEFVAKMELHIGRLDSEYFKFNFQKNIIDNNIIIYMVSDILPNIFVKNPLMKDWDDDLPFTSIPLFRSEDVFKTGERFFHIFICKVNYLEFFDNFKDIMSGEYFKKVAYDYLVECEVNGIMVSGYKTLKTIIQSNNKNVLIPTFIFKGKPWSFIVGGCLRNGINISGGSISRRHKLSRSTIELVLFMLRFNLIQNNEDVKFSYIENLFSRNFIDKKFYKEIIDKSSNNKELEKDFFGFKYNRFLSMLFIETLFCDVYSRLCVSGREYLINNTELSKLKDIKNIDTINKQKIETLERKEMDIIKDIESLESELSAIQDNEFIDEQLIKRMNTMFYDAMDYFCIKSGIKKLKIKN